MGFVLFLLAGGCLFELWLLKQVYQDNDHLRKKNAELICSLELAQSTPVTVIKDFEVAELKTENEALRQAVENLGGRLADLKREGSRKKTKHG